MNTPYASWNLLSRWPWLWFVIGFGMFLAAWMAFFIIAAKNPTPDVASEKPPTTVSPH